MSSAKSGRRRRSSRKRSQVALFSQAKKAMHRMHVVVPQGCHPRARVGGCKLAQHCPSAGQARSALTCVWLRLFWLARSVHTLYALQSLDAKYERHLASIKSIFDLV